MGAMGGSGETCGKKSWNWAAQLETAGKSDKTFSGLNGKNNENTQRPKS